MDGGQAMDDETVRVFANGRMPGLGDKASIGSDYVQFSLLFKIFVSRNEIADKRRLFFLLFASLNCYNLCCV